jgi:cyclohexanone monooxygenase
MLSGPGSPSVLANCIHGPEYQIDWLMEFILQERGKGHKTIDADPAAEQKWVEHVNEVGNHTLFVHTNSWYVGANVPGKPRVFMRYVGQGNYRRKCEEIAAQNYKGFVVA